MANRYPLVLDGTTIEELQSGDAVAGLVIGTDVQAYDADTTKNDVANTFTANQIVSVTDNTNAALRITQLGTGNALLVEDSANPDSTPFLIDSFGRVVSGNTSAITMAGTTPPSQQHAASGSAQKALVSWGTNTVHRADLQLLRSASGVIGTQGAVSSGYDLGALNFYGDDGTAFIQAAQVLVEVDGTPGTNDMPGRLIFSTTADGASSPTERMRISSTGVLSTSYAARGIISALTDGATITPDFNAANNFSVTLAGNRTLANPTNLTAGQSGSIFVTQDATGSRTLAYGTYWDFIGGTAPTLTTTASGVDRIDYVVRSTTSIHAVFTANYS